MSIINGRLSAILENRHPPHLPGILLPDTLEDEKVKD